MIAANMHDAKTQLSQYVAMVENGVEDRVVLMRASKPVAQIDPYDGQVHGFTFGLAKDRFSIGEIDSCNDEISKMFYGE